MFNSIPNFILKSKNIFENKVANQIDLFGEDENQIDLFGTGDNQVNITGANPVQLKEKIAHRLYNILSIAFCKFSIEVS